MKAKMYRTGLVSITFRQLSPKELVTLVAEAGQEGIEWGGDVHVPAGNLTCASEVRRLTEEAGLSVAAYGSYYRCGMSLPEEPDFERVLETAVALGAPSIRVWAGRQSPHETDTDLQHRIKEDLLRCADLASAAGIAVATEFHGNTLTETPEATKDLFAGIDEKRLFSLWQPRVAQSVQQRLDSIDEVRQRLLNVHVFQWGPNGFNDRLPLAAGALEWTSYLDNIAQDGICRWALLEFVADNDTRNFLRDAQTLHSLTAGESSSTIAAS